MVRDYFDLVAFFKLSLLTNPDFKPIEPGYTISFGKLKTHMSQMCNCTSFFVERCNFARIIVLF